MRRPVAGQQALLDVQFGAVSNFPQRRNGCTGLWVYKRLWVGGAKALVQLFHAVAVHNFSFGDALVRLIGVDFELGLKDWRRWQVHDARAGIGVAVWAVVYRIVVPLCRVKDRLAEFGCMDPRHLNLRRLVNRQLGGAVGQALSQLESARGVRTWIGIRFGL